VTDLDDLELDPSANGQVDSSPAASMTPDFLPGTTRPGDTPGPMGSRTSPRDADPDEEPPEPEGHPLTQKMRDFIEGEDFYMGPIPFDIAAVWAHPPHRVGDEATCRILLATWGEDAFRASGVHQAALQAAAREAASAPSRQAFKSEREKAKKR
jgi:hypothetical protein